MSEQQQDDQYILRAFHPDSIIYRDGNLLHVGELLPGGIRTVIWEVVNEDHTQIVARRRKRRDEVSHE